MPGFQFRIVVRQCKLLFLTQFLNHDEANYELETAGRSFRHATRRVPGADTLFRIDIRMTTCEMSRRPRPVAIFFGATGKAEPTAFADWHCHALRAVLRGLAGSVICGERSITEPASRGG